MPRPGLSVSLSEQHRSIVAEIRARLLAAGESQTGLSAAVQIALLAYKNPAPLDTLIKRNRQNDGRRKRK